MATGIFIGGRDGLFIEASPGYPRELAVATMSREEREICRMTGASIAAFTKARAKRLAGVDPVSGKAIPDVTEQPGLRPYPDPAADDDDRLAHRIPRDLVANTRHVVRFPKRAAARR